MQCISVGDGFVIAGGGGMVVLEELEHALARGAKVRFLHLFSVSPGGRCGKVNHAFVVPYMLSQQRFNLIPAFVVNARKVQCTYTSIGRQREEGRV